MYGSMIKMLYSHWLIYNPLDLVLLSIKSGGSKLEI